jgi:hypothetical protein
MIFGSARVAINFGSEMAALGISKLSPTFPPILRGISGPPPTALTGPGLCTAVNERVYITQEPVDGVADEDLRIGACPLVFNWFRHGALFRLARLRPISSGVRRKRLGLSSLNYLSHEMSS